MPTIAVGVAESHEGPADQWMEALRISEKTCFPGSPEVAEQLLASLVEQGFDVSRNGPIEYGNNLLMPVSVEAEGISRATEAMSCDS